MADVVIAIKEEDIEDSEPSAEVKVEEQERNTKDKECAENVTAQIGYQVTLLKDGGRSYKCTFCQQQFGTCLLVEKHVTTHANRSVHQNERLCVCNTCGTSFKDMEQLLLHSETHSSPQTPSTQHTRVKEKLYTHITERSEICTNNSEPYRPGLNVCDPLQVKEEQGGMYTNKAPALPKRRIINHYGKLYENTLQIGYSVSNVEYERPMFRCMFCEEEYRTAGLLRKHVAKHTLPFKCTLCQKGFRAAHMLRDHEFTHKTDKPFACEICDSKFSSHVAHKEHMRKHETGKNHMCPVCGKVFHRANLRKHMFVHTDERPCICEICGSAFKHKRLLMTHLKTHATVKEHVCETCGKAFTTKKSLNVHCNSHSGLKKYSCEVCGKTFSQAGSLHRHKRIHSGERPYECDQCDKKFTQSNALDRHKLTHIGLTQTQCPICHEKFKSATEVTKHKLTHQKADDEGDDGVNNESNSLKKLIQNKYIKQHSTNEKEGDETFKPVLNYQQVLDDKCKQTISENADDYECKQTTTDADDMQIDTEECKQGGAVSFCSLVESESFEVDGLLEGDIVSEEDPSFTIDEVSSECSSD